MRRYLSGVAALVAVCVALFGAGRALKDQDAEPRERRLDADAAKRANSIDEGFARAVSLWTNGQVIECLVPAVYNPRVAAFDGVLRLSVSPVMAVKTSYAPPSAPRVRVVKAAAYRRPAAPDQMARAA